MRLLNTRSLELRMFLSSSTIPDYVILSHRWCSEEVDFEDVTRSPIADFSNPARMKEGFLKLQGACNLAYQNGFEWIWIDTCCIDKSSSAELQEAINSMWTYYAEANTCYAYMADVEASQVGEDSFMNSELFQRGWTLQELIAPVCVEFYAHDWVFLGTKNQKLNAIAKATGINVNILLHKVDLNNISAAEKLSWAAHRKVTREEDEAYCLLGLFNINMPLLYGEGQARAFKRLQEEIYISTGGDHTLFLYRYSVHEVFQPLLADSATHFCSKRECGVCLFLLSKRNLVQSLPSELRYEDTISSVTRWDQGYEPIMTIRTSTWSISSTILPLLNYQDVSHLLKCIDKERAPNATTHVAVLNHTLQDVTKGVLCLLLEQQKGQIFIRTSRFPVLLETLGSYKDKLQMTKVSVHTGSRDVEPASTAPTMFTVQSDQFTVVGWSVYDCSSVAEQHGKNAMLKIHTPSSGGNTSPTIRCHLRGSDTSKNLWLCLIGKDNFWYIAKASEIPFEEKTLAPLDSHQDFGTVIFPDQQTVSVRLRRLAATRRTPEDNAGMHFRIIVGHFSEGNIPLSPMKENASEQDTSYTDLVTYYSEIVTDGSDVVTSESGSSTYDPGTAPWDFGSASYNYDSWKSRMLYGDPSASTYTGFGSTGEGFSWRWVG